MLEDLTPHELELEQKLAKRGIPGEELLKPDHYLFISYAHKDADAMLDILDMLDESGISYWYDQGIKSGKVWTEEVSARIKDSAQFLLLMSNAAQVSPNVNDEIYVAKKNKKDFVIVYLEEIELTDGLDLMIGRLQGIIRPKFSNSDDFLRRLLAGLSPKTKHEHENTHSENVRKTESLMTRISTQYEIVRLISDKGTRKTFLGTNRNTHLPVFIKQYIDSKDEPDNRLIFENEKRALTTCVCQNIPYLIDVYEGDSGGFLVENYIFGETLNHLHGISQAEALEIAEQLTHAVSCLHKNNLIHGDIKPLNIIISNYGETYLLDLNSSLSLLNHNYTWSRGTAFFAAPEQYERQYHPDVRTDFYGIGKTLEFILSQERNPDTRFPHFDKPVALNHSKRSRFLRIDDLSLVEENAVTADFETDDCTHLLYGLSPVSQAESRVLPELHPRVSRLLEHLTAYEKKDRPHDCKEVLDEIRCCRMLLDLDSKF